MNCDLLCKHKFQFHWNRWNNEWYRLNSFALRQVGWNIDIEIIYKDSIDRRRLNVAIISIEYSYSKTLVKPMQSGAIMTLSSVTYRWLSARKT